MRTWVRLWAGQEEEGSEEEASQRDGEEGQAVVAAGTVDAGENLGSDVVEWVDGFVLSSMAQAEFGGDDQPAGSL